MRGHPGWLIPASAIAPVCIGLVLRLIYLDRQPLLDDEVAAVRAVLRYDRWELLWTAGGQDFFRPLAFVLRALKENGARLTEWHFRATSVASGLLLLLALPRLAGRRLGGDVGTSFAWLLSLSPLLVIYSRVARSYMPALLFSTAGALLLADALERASRRSAVASALCLALAVWCHPMAAPFVLCGLAAGLGWAARTRSSRTSNLRSVSATVLGVFALTSAVLVLPTSIALLDQIRRKRSQADLDPGDLLQSGKYLAGSTGWVALVLITVLALAGAGLLWKRARILAAILLASAGGQFAGVWMLAPFGSEFELVLSRYLMFSLPALLLLVAIALVEMARPWLGPRAWIAAATLGLLLCAVGPLPRLLARPSSLIHHSDRLRFGSESAAKAVDPPTELEPACRDRSSTVGWVIPRFASRNLGALESIDRQIRCRFVLVDAGFVSASPGVEFRNSVAPDRNELRRVRSRLVVMRLDDFPFSRPVRVRPEDLRRPQKEYRSRVLDRIVAALGPPTRQDERFVIWRLSEAER